MVNHVPCRDRDKGNSCQHCNAVTVHARAARVGRANARELSHFHMSSTEPTDNEEWEGTGRMQRRWNTAPGLYHVRCLSASDCSMTCPIQRWHIRWRRLIWEASCGRCLIVTNANESRVIHNVYIYWTWTCSCDQSSSAQAMWACCDALT